MKVHLHRSRLVFVIILAAWASGRAVAGKSDGKLDIYWIDSEGGGSTLIVTPDGESILADTGNPGGRDSKRIHQVATGPAGLERIDHLIITHFHGDHFGGAPDLARLMPIGTVYDKGIPDSNPDNRPNDTRWAGMIQPYRDMKAGKREGIKPGTTIPLRASAGTPPVSLRFLAVQQQFAPGTGPAAANPACEQAQEKPADTSDNANSAVFLLVFGQFRFFDGGDLTWNTERNLVCPTDRVGTVDVYQVNHHGLDVSNNPVLIRTLSPTVSVMNNGSRKGCNPETFRTLQSVSAIEAMYQVHKNLSPNAAGNAPDTQIANLEADCAGHFIKLAVAPDSKTYTVSIPANQHERTFKSKH